MLMDVPVVEGLGLKILGNVIGILYVVCIVAVVVSKRCFIFSFISILFCFQLSSFQ